jgi:hypothetical protein
MFIPPNQTGIMNSLPAAERGAGAGMAATFNTSSQVVSIGVFFTLMIIGLSATLPGTLFHGLSSQGVAAGTAAHISHLPPVGSLFAAFLGYNPMAALLGPSIHHLPGHTVSYLTSRSFFPQLISSPFRSGLDKAFGFAALACVLGAGASLLRGGKYHYVPQDEVLVVPAERAPATETVEARVEPAVVAASGGV